MESSARLRTEVVQLRESNARLKKLINKLKNSNRSTLHLNKKLSNLALKDPHTGLYNRRHFKDTLEKELALANRHAQALSLIMMDIDYFKAVNDDYGHPFGDLVLKQFTKTLQKAVRRYDVLFRFGGEEFVMIAPRADRPTGLILAKRLLKTINAHRFGNKTHAINIKVSVSVASYPEDGVVIRGPDLVTLADRFTVAIGVRPDSDRIQLLQPFPAWDWKDYADLPILLKAKGKCTTDHISAAGPWLKYRGHLDRISDNMFSGAENPFTDKPGTGFNVLSGQAGEELQKIARAYKAGGLGWVAVGDRNSARAARANTPP